MVYLGKSRNCKNLLENKGKRGLSQIVRWDASFCDRRDRDLMLEYAP